MTSPKNTRIAVLVAAIGLLAFSQPVLADGTASGTTISNTVLLDYTVGGIAQDQLKQATTAPVLPDSASRGLRRVSHNPGQKPHR